MALQCNSTQALFATPLRQSHELVEGQKSANVKRISAAPPPLRPPIEMAEGVGFIEEKASFSIFGAQLAEGGARLVGNELQSRSVAQSGNVSSRLARNLPYRSRHGLLGF